MQFVVFGKIFIVVLMVGNSVICKSCVYCLWMVMNGFVNFVDVFECGYNEIFVDFVIGECVCLLIDWMFEFVVVYKKCVQVSGDLQCDQ